MAVVPIDPVSDPRVTHRPALLNGHTYHYLLGMPADGRFKATIFLVGLLGSQAPQRPPCAARLTGCETMCADSLLAFGVARFTAGPTCRWGGGTRFRS